MKLSHLLLTVPGVALAVVAFTPGAAFANPSTASATCQGGIVYEGHDYPSAGNTVTVKIDGVTVLTKTFGPSTSGTVAFPNKTSPHTWAVIWDRYNGTDGDRTQSGTVAACQAPPTTTVAATTTTVAQTTTTVSSVSTTTLPVSTTVATTTTDPAATTTSVVEVCCVVVPTTVPPTTAGLDVAVLTPEPGLPRTGGDPAIWFAAALVGGGVAALLIARRRA